MKLVIGLGNPDKKYQATRHNVGSWLVGELSKRWEAGSPHPASEGIVWIESLGVFVNQSGATVKKLVEEHKAPLDELLIIHDDLDVSLGEFKLQKGRGSAGHKGVESLIRALGSGEFWRLRIGIGRPPPGVEAETYVLDRVTKHEWEVIEGLIEPIVETLRYSF